MLEGVRAGKRSFIQRFWLDPVTGIAILIFWTIFKLLPVDAASWVGEQCSYPLSWVLHKKNKTARYNLKKCFPNKTDAERQQILRNMWKHLGRIMGELPHIEKMGPDRIEIIGKEYVKQMREDNKGGFIVSGHIGNWELSSAITLQLGMPLHAIYRAANNPWVEKSIYQHRRTEGVELLPKGPAGARRMIELLKQGGHFGILCDQKLREGIDVPFFGYPTKTAPAVASLALKFDVPIYPARVIRLKGAHYQCIFFPALQIKPSNDKEKDILEIMTHINQLFETWITDKPEQWLWIHHRWDKKEYPK